VCERLVKFLRKHYSVLAKQEMEPHLHHLIEFELEYLSLLKKQEEEIPLDVGIDECNTTGRIVCTTMTITKIP
jgi:hypothetical protein